MGRFAVIPLEVFQDRRLSLIQTRVLCALYSFRNPKAGDVVYPSRGEIESRTGYSERNVSKATSALMGFGWLEKDGDGGRSRAVRYTLIVPEIDFDELPKTLSEQDRVIEPETLSDPDGETLSDVDRVNATNPVLTGQGLRKETLSELDTPPLSDPDRGPLSDPDRGIEETKEQTKEETKSSCRELKFDDEDLRLAKWIFSLIQTLNPNHREPNLDSWANDVRLMRERDKRSRREIAELFDWANKDDFWRTNILSPATLRKQWDRLVIQRGTLREARQQPAAGSTASSGRRTTVTDAVAAAISDIAAGKF